MTELYVGLMSGTSMDGVDGVLLECASGGDFRVTHAASAPMPDALRAQLLALNHAGSDELHRAALAARQLVHVYAQVVADLLSQSGYSAQRITAIGAHGQTVRHQPAQGYTWQLNNPALLAELTGIAVVADFRSRCVAAGGQGAPLAPFFHAAVFAQATHSVAVLNLGGISNLTVLPPSSKTGLNTSNDLLGFDCGPGNALMDHWCQTHRGEAYDAQGAWAASGQVNTRLLESFLAEPYFALPPPKSTGRDLFHANWLTQHLQGLHLQAMAPQDVQATLCEVTVQCCAQAVRAFAPTSTELLVCGGGALNHHLMAGLRRELPQCQVGTTADRGIPAMQVEAAAFAWLAQKTVRGEALALKSTTGAKGSRILGCIYPA